MGLVQYILDFIDEKSSQLVDYVLGLFGSFDKISNQNKSKKIVF